MNGAFHTVTGDELVTKSSKKNKLAGGVQSETGSKVQTGIAQTAPRVVAGAQVEDLSPYLVQMHHAKKQAALAELKNAYDNSVAQLDRAENGMAEGYQAARNETAGVHEQERRNFAEMAAANGLNSGTDGQAELARSVTLQNNMNAIHAAEASAVADLTLKRAQAENEYNAAIAQAEYTGEHELAAALYKEKVRVQEALIEEEIRLQKYALEQAQARQKDTNTAETQSKQQLAEYGELYLKAGVMPSAQMCEAMGITQDDAHKYILAMHTSEK